MIRQIINELLFWFHFLIMIGSFYLIFILTPFVVLISIVLYKLHLKLFKGCVITKIQRRLGGLDENQTFTEKMYSKFFRKKIRRKYIRLGDIIIWTAITITFIRLVVK